MKTVAFWGLKFQFFRPDPNALTRMLLHDQDHGRPRREGAAALQAAKARGVVLENPNNLSEAAATKGRSLGVRARQAKADEFSVSVTPIIQDLAGEGMSLNKIAKELNSLNILTARRKTGGWTPTAVKNAIGRLQRD